MNILVLDYLKSLSGNLFCAGSMALIVFGLSILLHDRIPVWLALGIEILTGIALYALLVWVTRLRSCGETLGMLQEMLTRLKSGTHEVSSP